MTNSTKLEDKLEGSKNFWTWKYRLFLILEEHDLEDYVKGGDADPEGDGDKAKEDNNIIVDSTKDHFIPHVSSFEDSHGDVQCIEENDINMNMT